MELVQAVIAIFAERSAFFLQLMIEGSKTSFTCVFNRPSTVSMRINFWRPYRHAAACLPSGERG